MSLRAFEGWGLGGWPAGWAAYAPGFGGQPPGIDVDGGRFGDGIVDCGASAVTGYVGRTFDPQAGWYVGFPLWRQASPGSGVAIVEFALSGVGSQVYVIVNAARKFEVYRHNLGGDILIGTGTYALTAETWYFVEVGVTISDTVGTVQVYINGLLDVDISGADTKAQTSATADTIYFGGGPSGSGNGPRVGNVYVCDDQGGQNDTFLGDCRVITQVPTGDGTHTDWTCSAGGDHYALVDDAPPDGDTTYVASDAVGAMDTFTFPDLGVAGSVIAVKLCIDAEKDEVGPRTIAPVVRDLGTDYIYADWAPSAMSYGKTAEIFIVRPSDLNPWQASDISVGGAEFGVVVTS